MPAAEFEAQWQSFQMTGFRDWVPIAYHMWSQTPTPKGRPPLSPQKILKSMINIWLSPEPNAQEQTDEQQQAAAIMLTQQMGGRVVDGIS